MQRLGVFLSYSRKDEAACESLVQDIDTLGHDVWVDRELSGGQVWWDEILVQIRNADAFVAALSPDAIDSVACQREFEYAAALGKPIVPVIVAEGISTALLPPTFAVTQYVDYRQRSMESGLLLARTFMRLPAARELPDPLPAPPKVPISYLSGMRERVTSPTTPSFPEQSALLLELQQALRDGRNRDDVLAMMLAMSRRPDLFQAVASALNEEIARARSQEKAAAVAPKLSPPPPPRGAESNAPQSLSGSQRAASRKPSPHGIFAPPALPTALPTATPDSSPARAQPAPSRPAATQSVRSQPAPPRPPPSKPAMAQPVPSQPVPSQPVPSQPSPARSLQSPPARSVELSPPQDFHNSQRAPASPVAEPIRPFPAPADAGGSAPVVRRLDTRVLMAAAAALFLVAIGFAVNALNSPSAEPAFADSSKEKVEEEASAPERVQVPVTAAQPVRGPADAPVTIVQFSDFQCPFCSRVEATLTQLMKDYPGKLRLVWRNNPLPFHKDAMPAAQLVMLAMAEGGSSKFWELHGKLFENRRALGRADLEKYALEAGLDATKVAHALDDSAFSAAIKADQELAAKLDASGTPSFFINGRFLKGAQPIERFKEIIDDELARTDELIKNGTPKSELYATLIKNGATTRKPDPEPPKQPQPDPKAVYKVPVGDQPAKGPADALVTIVQFSDFQCPFCERVEPTVDEIMKIYGREVRVVWRNNPLPFHARAMPAASAALAAHEQGRFWEYHWALFEHPTELEDDDLERYARQLKLNVAKWRAAAASAETKAAIEADQALATSLGARGTPSFFINGRSLRGAQPLEAFQAVIDEELAKAKAMLERGVSPSRLYATIIENGATELKVIDDGPAPKP